MNTFPRPIALLLLLGFAVLFLPACGSKTNVKSEKAPETVLNPDSSSSTPFDTTVHVKKSYTAKIRRIKGPNSTTTITTTPVDASTPVNTPVVTQSTPPMETAAPVKKSGGSHWFLWLLVVLALGGIGWYFWSKHQENQMIPPPPPPTPKPPLGGLSPVSGFTAVKDRIEDGPEKRSSIWTKKLF